MSVKHNELGTLGKPTPPDEILQREGPRGKTLDYVDARFVMDRLDEIGPENWQDAYVDRPDGSVRGGIGINVEGEWVWKWDVGTASDIEPEKGAYSEALKRAGVKWGIGRDLYTHKGKATRATSPLRSQDKPVEPESNEPVSLGAYATTGLAGINPSPAAKMDGNLRAEKEHGHMLGFVLATSAEGRIPQVVAVGDLAVDIADAIEGKGSYFDQRKVTVEGELFDVWFTPKGTTTKRKFQRLVLSRLETDDFALPSPSVVPGQEALELA